MTNILHAWLTRSIVIVLLVLLGSCSMLRTGYNQAPQLAWWWLDGYLDFGHHQTAQAKEAIRLWFEWHRSTQLPQYAAQLSAMREHIHQPVTSDEICDWYSALRTAFTPALEHAVQLGAPLVRNLDESQLRHLERRYGKNNEEFRDDYLQPSIEARRKASVKRTVKRFENLYGHLNEAQKRLITDNLSASPFNPEAWLAERQRRQSETLTQLRKLIATSADAQQAETVLLKLARQLEQSPDPEYQSYQMKLTNHNCAFVADMHNSTTTKQRRHARDKLGSWETDLRALVDDLRQ